MNKWIAIFRTGTHTDSKGVTKEWTIKDLDQTVSSYDPNDPAPVVIGHPKTDSPAWAWVAALKREGETLYSKMKDLVPEFQEMLQKKMFKNRSISLNANGTLRHIGFLGATPPAVKGLEDIAFSENDGSTIKFEEYRVPTIGRILQRMREFIIEKFGTEAADRVVSDYEIDELKRVIPDDNEKALNAFKEKEEINMSFIRRLKDLLKSEGVDVSDISTSPSFSEAQIKEVVNEAMKEAQAEFAETVKKKDTEFTEREAKLKEKVSAFNAQVSEAQKKEISDFCEGLKGKGTLTPAMEKLGMGITKFMQQISTIETTSDFADGDGKQTPLEFMQSFLGSLPQAIEFGEVAGKGKDTGKTGDTEKIDNLVSEYMSKNEGTVLKDAVKAVAKEHPELFTREEG